jgi:hypothetical protein
MLGITGAVRDNVWLLGICTFAYTGMAVWCFFFLLDPATAMYYTGIAYPNWLYIEELRNSSIDESYQEENGSSEMNNNDNTTTPYYQHPDAIVMEQNPNSSEQQHASSGIHTDTNTTRSVDIESQPNSTQRESNTKRKWFRMFQRK